MLSARINRTNSNNKPNNLVKRAACLLVAACLVAADCLAIQREVRGQQAQLLRQGRQRLLLRLLPRLEGVYSAGEVCSGKNLLLRLAHPLLVAQQPHLVCLAV